MKIHFAAEKCVKSHTVKWTLFVACKMKLPNLEAEKILENIIYFFFDGNIFGNKIIILGRVPKFF